MKKVSEEMKEKLARNASNLLRNEIEYSLEKLIEQVEMETRIEKNKECELNKPEKITLYSFIMAHSDCAFNRWFLTEVDAVIEAENESQSDIVYDSEFVSSIETFVGSKTHTEAVENSKNLDRTFEQKVRAVRIITPLGEQKYKG